MKNKSLDLMKRMGMIEEISYNNILKESKNTLHFKEIKYFHKTGGNIPNGIGFQRGAFIKECKDNANSFIISEGIHSEQYGLSKYKGGIITFSTDVNAVQLDDNAFINKIKQIVSTFNQRIKSGTILHKIVNKFNKYNKNNDYIGAYSIGNFFKGKYVGDNGEKYSEKSTTIEINGLSSEGLLYLSEFIAKVFHQETVLVKDFNNNKIYLADAKHNENNDFNQINNAK